MKITNQTSDQMTVQDSGSGAFVGIIFLVFGLGYLYVSYKNGQTGAVQLGFPALFAFIGLVMILLQAKTTVDIDKSAGTIAFSRKSLVSSKANQYSIADVQSVELRESSYASNNTMNNANTPQGITFGNNNTYNRTLSHQTVLVMKDGTEAPLESVKSSNSSNNFPGGILMSGRGKMFATSNQVAQFIGVPFKEVTSDGIVANAPMGNSSEIIN